MAILINPFRFAAAAGLHWQELGRTTLGSTGDDITVSSLANKPYLMVLYYVNQDGAAGPTIRVNGDTGSNYAWRNQRDGTSDTTGTSETYINLEHSGNTTNDFGYGFISNISGQETLTQTHSIYQGTAGAGNTPNRQETVGKWANTSTISSLTIHNPDAGSFDTGSEVVVLGYDPADTTGGSVWEELADVTLGSAGDNISSGTITAKKYLWCQVHTISSGENTVKMQLNNDTGANYAYRISASGGADSTQSSIDEIYIGQNSGDNTFTNFFVVNVSAQEKLVIGNSMEQNSAGATNAPNRTESVGKWANTSAQITEIDINNTQTGDFASGTRMKVWGFD